MSRLRQNADRYRWEPWSFEQSIPIAIAIPIAIVIVFSGREMDSETGGTHLSETTDAPHVEETSSSTTTATRRAFFGHLRAAENDHTFPT